MRTRWMVAVGLAAMMALASSAWADPDDDSDQSKSDSPQSTGSRWDRGDHSMSHGPARAGGSMRGGMMRGRAMRGGSMRAGARRGGWLRDLDLSADQRKRMLAIRDGQQRKAIQQRADMRVAGLDLRKLMRAEQPDRAAIDRQIDAISHMRAELRKSQVNALLDARAVLTPEQRQKARDRIMDGRGNREDDGDRNGGGDRED